MDSENKNKYIDDDTVNIREIFEKYARHWKFIVICVVLAFIIGFLYLKSRVPTYESKAMVIVRDDKSGVLSEEINIFSDLGIITQKGNIYNEIEIFRSRRLLTQVIKDLSLNISILKEGDFLHPNYYYYKDAPIKLQIETPFVDIDKITVRFEFSPTDNHAFKLKEIYRDQNGEEISTYIGKCKYGDLIETSIGVIKIEKNNWDQENEDLIIIINDIENTVNEYRDRLTIQTVNRDASAIEIKITGPNKELNNDFLNTLILRHQSQAIQDKNIIARNTSQFIDERMKVIEDELSDIEEILQTFMSSEKIVDINLSVQNILNKESSVEKNLIDAYVQLKLAQQIRTYLDQHTDFSTLLPANLGITDQSINNMTKDYNQLVLERNALLLNSSPQNPLVTKIEKQIIALRASLSESLDNLIENLKLQTQTLEGTISNYTSNLSSVPAVERRYREIMRQQQIKETLYLYLLQKREETEIAMASTVGNVKLVDPAYSSIKPITPKKTASMLVALIIGLFFPIIVIYFRDLFDNKVHTTEDLEFLNVPIVSNIPLKKSDDIIVIKENIKGHLAEAFRTLRSNLEFIFIDKKEKGNTIFVTSTVPGEGKTFVSLNLAVSYTLINAKVLILELDLHAPRISHYLNMPESKGISDYLKDDNMSINDIIIHSVEYKNLDYITTGTIPPNPSELLMRPKLADFFDAIKKEYDYIIVDNAPIGLVVDTLSIISYADIILYVVRAEYLDKRALGFTNNFIKNKNVNNISLVLNGTKVKSHSYYGYGYGYYSYQYDHYSQKNENKIKQLFNKYKK
jgi:capsular exopolysaccharide synthesis family protein